MGNSESNPVKNIDKRTARREYSADFSAAIDRYRQQLTVASVAARAGQEPVCWKGGEIVVCVRKRPINANELEGMEFDVVTTLPDKKTVVIHDARMGSDMKSQYIEHYPFRFNMAFSERDGNDVVYENTVSHLVDVAISGRLGTCMMYGQTGSGKTYTMSSFYEKVSRDLFSRLESRRPLVSRAVVSVSFVEISGDYCFDLYNQFSPVELLQVDGGGFQPYPVVEPVVNSAEQLLALINYGCGVRSTAATGVHDSSSRSHAVLKIYVRSVTGKGSVTEGVLSLIDLAGSEHRIDSMYHSSERRAEGAEINASLAALKDCLRAKADSMDLGNIYRRSKLTMLLKSSFIDPCSETVVIVCMSPSSKDTEHTLNSLRYASIMENADGVGSSKLLNKNRRGVVSTIDTGLGPKKNPFSVVEMIGGDEHWKLDHIMKLEMGYQYIGTINLTAIAREKRQMRQLGIHVPELRTDNGNHKTQDGSSDGGDSKRSFDLILRQRRSTCRTYEAMVLDGQSLELLQCARGSLGRCGPQNQRLSNNPQTKVLKALSSAGVTDAVPLSTASGGIDNNKKVKATYAPRKRNLYRASSDNLDDSIASDRSRICHPMSSARNDRTYSTLIDTSRIPRSECSRDTSQYPSHGPGTQSPKSKEMNIRDVIPKSSIKVERSLSHKSMENRSSSKESDETVSCSIIVGDKLYTDITISRAIIEAAIDTEKRAGLTMEAKVSSTTSTRARSKEANGAMTSGLLSSREFSVAENTNHRDDTPLISSRKNTMERAISTAPFRTDTLKEKSSDPKRDRTDALGQRMSREKYKSPKVKVSKYAALSQRGRPFSTNCDRNSNLSTAFPDEFKVVRQPFSGGAGGLGWIPLDEPLPTLRVPHMPEENKCSRSVISASCGQNRRKHEVNSERELSAPRRSSTPINNVSRSTRIDKNELPSVTRASNIWTPEMAIERYGQSRKSFFSAF